MDRLCDEILQLILNELSAPASFALLSKRHYEFTKDPYVRAMYFLARYGRMQALYFALGRGKLLNAQVIDIIMRGGAHLSRYLVQCAIHHYFRTQVPFIKTRWVRTIPFPVFSHFLSIASNKYGDVPVGKGDDDGTVLTLYLKQSRFPTEYRAAKWEQVRDVIEKFKFIPFSDRDPMMAQFPLVLAIEPRLLPLARQNGFNMDRKYRNFVFRRMFEKPAIMFESRADEIVQNVRELSRLDPDMFLSRTVAAEICMEAKTNEPAYKALKRLDKEGILRFELSAVVQDLVRLFSNTRSVNTAHTAAVLRVLYKDFPSTDPSVRLVLLLTIFLSDPMPVPASLTMTSATSAMLARYVELCHDEIEELSLGPLTRQDITDVLLSKFVPERFGGILEYARVHVGLDEASMRGVVTDVALRCLEIGCKGRMLAKLVDAYAFLEDAVAAHVVKAYRVRLEDLPPLEDDKACKEFSAPLCADFTMRRGLTLTLEEALAALPTVVAPPPPPPPPAPAPAAHAERDDAEHMEVDGEEFEDEEASEEDDGPEEDLGSIGQDTLSAMIRKDEMMPTRRRRYHDLYSTYHDSMSKLPYPADYTQVGTWLQNHYGHRSAVAAVARLHAVINQNYTVLHHHLYTADGPQSVARVPTTLKHFKILSRLGRIPSSGLWEDIEGGCEFYFSEEDYLNPEELSGAVPPPPRRTQRKVRGGAEIPPLPARLQSLPQASSSAGVVKHETSPVPGPSSGGSASASASASAGPPTSRATGSGSKKRPRRSVASTVKSYAVPDSDDEDIVMDGEDEGGVMQRLARKRKEESNLQKWIKHLAGLFKEEQRKFNERKRRIHAATPPGTKVKVTKTEFHKSLAFNLPRLRRVDRARREKLYGADVPDDDFFSESDDDEYHFPSAKRRKVEA